MQSYEPIRSPFKKSRVKDVSSSKDFLKEVERKGVTIVSAKAAWCGACPEMVPVIERIAKKNKKVSVVRIDVDKAPQIADALGVTHVPTIAFFKNGKLAAKVHGVDPEGVEKTLGKLLK